MCPRTVSIHLLTTMMMMTMSSWKAGRWSLETVSVLTKNVWAQFRCHSFRLHCDLGAKISVSAGLEVKILVLVSVLVSIVWTRSQSRSRDSGFGLEALVRVNISIWRWWHGCFQGQQRRGQEHFTKTKAKANSATKGLDKMQPNKTTLLVWLSVTSSSCFNLYTWLSNKPYMAK